MINYAQICRNIAETKRLMKLTAYQRSNERAADHKADRWLHYIPLHPNQLHDDDEIDWLNIHDDFYGALVIIARPTEVSGLQFAQGKRKSNLEQFADHPPVNRKYRYCMKCEKQHPQRDFLQSSKYLHHYSYYCKKQLRTLRNAHWRFGGLDTFRTIRIDVTLRKVKDDKAALRKTG